MSAHPIHNLVELSKRHALKPYDIVQESDESFLSERVVFKDTATGTTIWKLTRDPALNRHAYYDIPAWSSDGSRMMFMSCRPGGDKWIMRAVGSGIAELPIGDSEDAGIPFGNLQWGEDPQQVLFTRTVGAETEVVSHSVGTGEQEVLFSVECPNLTLCPLTGEQTRLLLAARSDDTKVYTVDSDGSNLMEVPIGGQVHRIRFTKAADHSIFFNRDDPRTSWVINEDGSDPRKLRGDETVKGGGHPDWSPDGACWSFYAEGGIRVMNRDGTNERVLVDLQAGGHGGWSPDGRYIVSDVAKAGPYANQIILVSTDEPHRVQTLAYHNASYQGWKSGHPDPEATHPAPIMSPDGTKVMYDSDMLDEAGGLYVAVVCRPRRPTHVTARPSDGRVQINWWRPDPGSEIAGYDVYRSSQSGGPFKRINKALVDTELYVDDQVRNGEPAHYVVTAVEHSGLESAWSPEVSAAPPWQTEWQGNVRHYHPLSEAKCTGAFNVERAQGSCDGLAVVAADSGPSRAEIEIAVPKDGTYFFWLRGIAAENEANVLTVQVDDVDTGLVKITGGEWLWNPVQAEDRLAGAVLTKGAHRVAIEGEVGTFQSDLLLVTDDTAFRPEGPACVDTEPPSPVRDIEAFAAGPLTIGLCWDPPDDPDLAHFNVYTGTTAEFDCTQEHLVGSPLEAEFYDWGLAPTTRYYYRVTAVDSSGNESAPSPPIERATEDLRPRTLTLDVTAADLSGSAQRFERPEDRQIGARLLGADHPDSTDGEAGAIEMQAVVTEPGAYFLWAELMHKSGSAGRGPARVTFGDGPTVGWAVGREHNRWVWRRLQGLTVPGLAAFELEPGTYSLKIECGGYDLNVARIVLSSDPQLRPEEAFPLAEAGAQAGQ